METPSLNAEMNCEVKTALARHFVLGEVLQCAPLKGTRNQNFVLQTSTGRWFVRERYAGYAAPEWVAFDSAAITFLSERGVPVTEARTGADCRRWWHDGGTVWQVFPCLNGHAFDVGNVEETRALGRAVGQFHCSGQAFPERYDKLGPRGETSPAELIRISETIEAEAPECEVPLRRYREWIAEATSVLPDRRFASLPHTLVHGDVQPANVVIAGDGVAWLVDLDWCAWRPRIYDLGFAFLFCCAARADSIDGSNIWSLTQACQLCQDQVHVFLEEYGGVCTPLSTEETAMLHPQMVLSWCSSRLTGALKVPTPERAQFLARPPATLSELGLHD